MDDEGPQGLPPLGARTATALGVLCAVATALYLAVRELSLRLVP